MPIRQIKKQRAHKYTITNRVGTYYHFFMATNSLVSWVEHFSKSLLCSSQLNNFILSIGTQTHVKRRLYDRWCRVQYNCTLRWLYAFSFVKPFVIYRYTFYKYNTMTWRFLFPLFSLPSIKHYMYTARSWTHPLHCPRTGWFLTELLNSYPLVDIGMKAGEQWGCRRNSYAHVPECMHCEKNSLFMEYDASTHPEETITCFQVILTFRKKLVERLACNCNGFGSTVIVNARPLHCTGRAVAVPPCIQILYTCNIFFIEFYIFIFTWNWNKIFFSLQLLLYYYT